MRIEVIGKDLPYVGKRGTQHEVLDGIGYVLMRIGRVKEVMEPEPKPEPKPKDVPADPPDETDEPPKKKPPRRKRYGRRDMQAEQSDE
jgi:hypothetical protein